jgi:hypothetical protein
MMRSSVIVAAAVTIGFVSVLIYRVSASDAQGLGQFSTPASHVTVASGETSPLKVEFIVQQCDIATPEVIEVAAQPEVLEVPAAGAASTAIAPSPGDVPESASENAPVTGEGGFVVLSPSILYIP